MIIRVFVDQSGKAKVRHGTQILPIIERMQHAKEKLEMRNERFYWLAAKWLIKEEDYYKLFTSVDGIAGNEHTSQSSSKESRILNPIHQESW